jgi:hypothetical protein
MSVMENRGSASLPQNPLLNLDLGQTDKCCLLAYYSITRRHSPDYHARIPLRNHLHTVVHIIYASLCSKCGIILELWRLSVGVQNVQFQKQGCGRSVCHFIFHPSGFQAKKHLLPTRRGEKPKSKVGKIPRYSMLYWWSSCFRLCLLHAVRPSIALPSWLSRVTRQTDRSLHVWVLGGYIYILMPPFIRIPFLWVLFLFPFLLGHFLRPVFNDV